MAKFRVHAIAHLEVVTEVEAEDWEEAERIASDREVDICIHGSDFVGGNCEDEFILVDGIPLLVSDLDAEELE